MKIYQKYKYVLIISVFISASGIILTCLNISGAHELDFINHIEWEALSVGGFALYSALIAYQAATLRQTQNDNQNTLNFISRDFRILMMFKADIFSATSQLKHDFDAAPHTELILKNYESIWEICCKANLYDLILSKELNDISISLIQLKFLIERSRKEPENSLEFKNSGALLSARQIVSDVITSLQNIEKIIEEEYINSEQRPKPYLYDA
ncbi:hypothetical protein [Thalassospira sp. MCCC 1A03138]|uniref:hypothetical protein n=1 Tax=Thalassospira sp. MCCC 1A03138 TaxID=1470576 RepID=UPI00111C5A08|nr:hypothetical protein [Thalassospira sp. MCCC 1A03138]